MQKYKILSIVDVSRSLSAQIESYNILPPNNVVKAACIDIKSNNLAVLYFVDCDFGEESILRIKKDGDLFKKGEYEILENKKYKGNLKLLESLLKKSAI